MNAMTRWTVLIKLVWWNPVVHDSPSWNLGRVKQGDTIRVDGASHQGQEDVKESEEWVQRPQSQAANESAGGRKTKASQECPRLDDCMRGREHHR